VLESRPPEFAVRIDRRVPMQTADGVTLRADVYRPVRAGRTPTILVRIPFSKTFTNTLFATVIGRFWAERGYTVVVQGTRGRYESGGRFYPLISERQDGHDALAWVAGQPWFNGSVGTWGGSAFGHTQWALVDKDPASLHAMMVQIWSTDFHGVVHRGGAFALQSSLFWAMRSGGPTDVWPDETTLARAAATRPVRDADDRAGGDVAFFNDWIDHAERDAYWEAIDGTDRSRRLGAPIHLMAGWYDPFLPGQLADFVRIRRQSAPAVARRSRLVIGPWAHAETVQLPGNLAARNYRLESLAPSLPWFDRHLRGLLPIDDPSAPLRLFVMGINQWRDEQEWPLSRARPVAFYLRSDGHARGLSGDGRLAPEAPAAGEPADVFDYDPNDPVPTKGGAMLGSDAGIARQNDVEARNDVLVYSGPPLETDLEVTGDVSVRLYVSTTAPSTDFTAKLVDVHPDGAAYNVADGILRRSYVPVSAPARAQPTSIDIELGPTSIVFRRGHRIRLEISSSNFPRFDRNPNTGDAASTAVRSVTAMQALHHGPAAASFMLLPVVP
jgi:putative CocE/NonD family hydrolase